MSAGRGGDDSTPASVPEREGGDAGGGAAVSGTPHIPDPQGPVGLPREVDGPADCRQSAPWVEIAGPPVWHDTPGCSFPPRSAARGTDPEGSRSLPHYGVRLLQQPRVRCVRDSLDWTLFSRLELFRR